MSNSKITVDHIKSFKKSKKPFVAITAYDYCSGSIIDKLDFSIVLVGDSASMVTYGYSTTIPVSMKEMLVVCRAVTRAIKNPLVVGDMPFMSYQSSVSAAIKNAGLIIKDGGCSAVKLEGGVEITKQVEKITSIGIPVMGHVGLTPQSVNAFSGYKTQGKNFLSAQKILDDARALENAGAFAIVLECIPSELSEHITNSISIPTIGIGAGKHCDGQIQVFHDVLGLSCSPPPKHAMQYKNLNEDIVSALQKYKSDIEKF